MSLYFAAEIEGLRNPLNPNDGNRVLFVHGDITALTLPAGLAASTVLGLLENNDPGENWSGDLRKPLGSGGAQSLRLFDTEDGALGRLLQFDPTEDTWDIEVPVLSATALVLRVSGSRAGVTAPPLGFYWIEEECVRITNVATVPMGGGTSALSYQITISRGQCGSRAVVHQISTAAYAPGDDGREERLTLWQRPYFGAFRFRATLYLLNSPFATSPAEIVEARHFFVDEEPLPGIPSYEVKLRDVAEAIEQHTFQIGTEARCFLRLLVLSEGTERTTAPGQGGSTITTVRKLPSECVLYLDRLRAAQLFGSPLSNPTQSGFSSVLVLDLNNRLRKSPQISYLVKLKTRKHEWLFAVGRVRLASFGSSNPLVVLEVALSLVDYPKGQSLDDEPDTPEDTTADQTIHDSYPNTTFTTRSPIFGAFPIPVREEVPTLELWYSLRCSPIDAYLYLTTSNGAFGADPYDALIGRGLGIPSDWQSRGTAPLSPLSVRWDTLDLLELRALLNEEYTYYVKSGDKLGDFLVNLCTLHTLMHGPRNSGPLTLVRWARPLEGETPIEIDPDISQPVSPGERLTPLRAFLLYSGIKLLTLEPEFVRSVTLGGVAYRESGAPLPVRVWQPGNQLTDEKLQQGAIGHLLRAFFSTMGGAPVRLSIPSSVLAQNFEIGSFVLVTNDRLPTPQGRGLVGVRHIVVGADLNYRTGIKTYRLLRDYYNDLPQSVGFIAPSLSASPPIVRDPTLFEIPLSSLGDSSFDPSGDHFGIWNSLQGVGGFVHVVNPSVHNPTNQNEVEGWAECYGRVTQVIPDSGTGQGRLVVEVDPAWTRGGVTPEQLLTRGAFLSLVDRRPEDSNPQSALIEPIGSQLASANDFLTFAARVSFQRNFSVIG